VPKIVSFDHFFKIKKLDTIQHSKTNSPKKIQYSIEIDLLHFKIVHSLNYVKRELTYAQFFQRELTHVEHFFNVN
jgi:hypothetical protein